MGGRSWGVLQRVEVGGGGEVFRFGCEAVDEAPLVEPYKALRSLTIFRNALFHNN